MKINTKYNIGDKLWTLEEKKIHSKNCCECGQHKSVMSKVPVEKEINEIIIKVGYEADCINIFYRNFYEKINIPEKYLSRTREEAIEKNLVCDMWKMKRIQDDYNGLNEDDI